MDGGVAATPMATANAVAAVAEPKPQHAADTDIADPDPGSAPAIELKTYENVVALFAARREAVLYAALSSQVHLVQFEPGHISVRAREEAAVFGCRSRSTYRRSSGGR